MAPRSAIGGTDPELSKQSGKTVGRSCQRRGSADCRHESPILGSPATLEYSTEGTVKHRRQSSRCAISWDYTSDPRTSATLPSATLPMKCGRYLAFRAGGSATHDLSKNPLSVAGTVGRFVKPRHRAPQPFRGTGYLELTWRNGAPCTTRTCDLLVRSLGFVRQIERRPASPTITAIGDASHCSSVK